MSPSRHTSHGRTALRAKIFGEGRPVCATAANDPRAGCSPDGLGPAPPDRAALPKRLVLMTNDAHRKGSRALAIEGRANRVVLCSPERGAARQGRVLGHLLLERQTLVRLEAVVHVGVQIREARRPPSLDNAQMRSRPRRRRRKRAGQRRNPLASLGQSRDQGGQRDIKRRSGFPVGEPGQNDDQQRLSELQGERADCRRDADLARARLAVGVFPILIPAELPIIEGEAANMPAMKANELAKGADAGVVESRSVCVVSNALADRFERGLPEQTIDQRGRRSMIEHEPVVARQRDPELAEVTEIARTIA